MLFKNDNEFVEITVCDKTLPSATDYWDGNWLNAEIAVAVKGFNANYNTSLRAQELYNFYDELTQLYNYKIKEIEFTTLEEGIYLKIRSQTNGTFDCQGVARCGVKNNLEFELIVESEALKYAMNQLQTIIKCYPVMGKP